MSRQDSRGHTAGADALSFAGSNDCALPTRAEFIALATAYAPLTPSNTPFVNVIANGGYWTSTVFTPGVSQWDFTPPSGLSGQTPVNLGLFAVAVRSGSVVVPVPEPQTLALALSALGALVVAQRRRRSSKQRSVRRGTSARHLASPQRSCSTLGAPPPINWLTAQGSVESAGCLPFQR